VLVGGCAEAGSYEAVETFFLRNDGADMPVWITGNTDAQSVLIFLNGGPGGGSSGFWKFTAFSQLAEKYTLVFWDQRSAGFTLGSPPEATLTAEASALDLDLLVEVIRARLPGRRVFLMGHSWGGQLGSIYLSDPVRQAKIAGWVEVDGAHNFKAGSRLSAEWVKERASQRLLEPSLSRDDRTYWTEAITWYEHNPVDSWGIDFGGYPTEWIKHVEHVVKANGYVPADKRGLVDSEFKKAGTYSRFVGLYATGMARWYGRPLWNLDATPVMSAITLPTLIIWGEEGEEDGILPRALAADALDALGTPPDQKRVVYFEDSGHSPLIDAPFEFAAAVIAFVDEAR
jgi:pimeloyl-ACP methyl ester carboxylesterase